MNAASMKELAVGTDYGPEFAWLNSPGLPEQLKQLAAQPDDFGDRMTIFPGDARAILAAIEAASKG